MEKTLVSTPDFNFARTGKLFRLGPVTTRRRLTLTFAFVVIVVLLLTAAALAAQSASGSISFSAPAYSVDESSGSVAVTLTRAGGTDNKVVVKVDLADVTTSRDDYSGPGSVEPFFNSAPGFTTATGTDNVVGPTVVQADGKILLGGSFTVCRGVPRRHIARLNQDGTLDMTFDPGTGTDQGSVSSIAVQADGKILISGFFFHYNGVPQEMIARLNTDGSLDTTFKPSPDVNATSTIHLQTDGKILVSGGYRDGTVSRYKVLRLNTDGSLDTTFDSGVGATNTMSVRALQPDGKIIIAGEFTNYNGTSRSYFARLNTDGSIDTTFNPVVDENDAYNSITLQPDGKLIAAGSVYDVKGVHGRIKRHNADGSLDTTFDQGTGPNLSIYTAAVQPDGRIIIAGNFTTYNGVTRRRLARLESNGSLDASFEPGLGADASIYSLNLLEDGKLVIGGEFSGYGTGYRSHIAEVYGDQLVTWAAGDASNKTIRIPITNDTLYESNETLNLSLSVRSGGATTGETPVSTLTIIDDDEPKIQFDGTTSGTSEGLGRITVLVSRSNTSVASTVAYETSDAFPISLNCQSVNTGIASSRCDYTTKVGTLQFAPGESIKAIAVPIIDDNFAEGTESFTITLSNPTGGILGANKTATLTIFDNETVNGSGNPIDTVRFFVREQYIDFLGREPDISGNLGWQDILNNCPSSGKDANGNFCDRIEVSAGFFRSEEFQSRGYFIYKFYSALGRIPLYPEFMPDLAKVSGFLSAQQLEDSKAAFVIEFMARSEFQNKYGAITDAAAYVNALLTTVGLPNHPSRAGWIAGLNNGSITRARVLRELTESSEMQTKYSTESFVIMQYFGYLRRSADASYLAWIDIMNQNPANYRGMIDGFINSDEYRKRFGQ
jgi:uncharacterized delta-60 repeat protein